MVTLGIGLVLGTSTGYASGRVESERERHAIETSTAGVTRQLNALRGDLAQMRIDLLRLAANGAVAHSTLISAQSEADSVSANIARIEASLTSASDASTHPAFAILRTAPVRNAWTAITCGSVAAALPPARTVRQSIPVITLPAATVRSTQTLGSVLGVHQMADGRLLVNDGSRRQVKLFDSTLVTPTIIMDSASGLPNSYGRIVVTLVPFLGDSSLFADFNSRTLQVLDGRGQAARSVALPNPQDLGLIGRAPSATDPSGRVVYSGYPKVQPGAMGSGILPTFSDSIPLLRADFDGRRVDTLAALARPVAQLTSFTPDGKTVIHQWLFNPIAAVDDWALLSDGSIAIVRGRDYHIDWIRPNGAQESSPKLAFDWKRLTDAEKQRILDSTRAALHRVNVDSAFMRDNMFSMSRLPTDLSTIGTSGGGGRAGGAGPGRACGMMCDLDSKTLIPSPTDVVSIEKMPDYYPPVRARTTMADRDGNLWILPTTSAQSQHGELVYDVVNVKGELFERVRVPLGRLIVGFGKGGVVYMVSGDKATGFYLERSILPSAAKSTSR
ncbi:MAG TPA: hypothetical protein VHV78_07520 [Gemmatimonadaceae bacterium]|nr:hypothetical protein [Gemmatimonadaceae bacterium]